MSEIEIRIDQNRKFSEAKKGDDAARKTEYIGIAYDEPKRIERHKDRVGVEMPLVEAEWTEAMCRKWCEENDLLSPLYQTSNRGGCWFCHNQSIDQLRMLRKEYPDLWALLMKWDNDSPWTFKPGWITVHDIDQRLQMEEEGYFDFSDFRWSSLKAAQMNMNQFLK